MDNHCTGKPQQPEYFSHGFGQSRVVYSQHLCLRPGGIGQRAKNIEDRSASKFLPDWHYMAHGGMVVWCEEKRDSHLFYDYGLFFRINREVHAKCGEHIRRSTGAADAAVPMLDNRDTGTCRHKS
jgi:hypothetical protein